MSNWLAFAWCCTGAGAYVLGYLTGAWKPRN